MFSKSLFPYCFGFTTGAVVTGYREWLTLLAAIVLTCVVDLAFRKSKEGSEDA